MDIFLRQIIAVFLLAAIMLTGCAQPVDVEGGKYVFVDISSNSQKPDGSAFAPYKSLEDAIEKAQSGDEIYILPGKYEAVADRFEEPLCGNCENHATTVQATVGFWIQDKVLKIRGKHQDSVILVTNAGYGVLFDHSWGSQISKLTITGGNRDLDGNATDAGIVVRFSRLTVENCKIINNDHRLDSVVVGIGGVFGRESSELIIRDNVIENNGWDGVALYRGAKAMIVDNVIDKGRGAGIGITWDAQALVTRNRISHYWKGIGTFGNSTAAVTNNIVYDNLGWGIIATGASLMEARNNVIARNGNCGFAAWSDEARGILKNNIIVNNGWKEEWVCPCVGIWINTKSSNFVMAFNDVWNNKAGEYQGLQIKAGENGNLAMDPQFIDSLDFHLQLISPLRGQGDPYYTNPDGSRSDFGAYGGQGAGN